MSDREARPSPPPAERSWPRRAVLLAACLAFILHAALFGGWLIDDAGISFVYARNLAAGHGLVSQPGLPPVEGYSNPLWVFLLAATAALHLFDPLWTPKLLALALAFATFALLDRILARLGLGLLASATALFLLAAQTSFVVWSISGLENPLYACLATALALFALSERDGRRRIPLLAGLAAAGLALTRPEGILFGGLYPLAVLVSGPGRTIRTRLGRLGRYLAAYLLPVGLHLTFRLAYFGSWAPNTFYAKGGPSLQSFDPWLLLRREGALARAAAGSAGSWLALALLAVALFLAWRRKLRSDRAILLAAVLVSSLPYVLLPTDWMPELRFATPFFPIFYAAAVAIAAALGSVVPLRAELRPALSALAALAALGILLSAAVPRSLAFSADPTVPFATVEERWGRGYNRIADRLGVAGGSLLLPDVGGTLWSSRLRVYDLAGLCDPTIARTIRGRPKAFHDYVFGKLRPTFIHTHDWWTRVARLDRDPRFARDYVALFDYPEPRSLQHRSGDYVRREIALRHPAEIATLRAELAAAHAGELPR